MWSYIPLSVLGMTGIGMTIREDDPPAIPRTASFALTAAAVLFPVLTVVRTHDHRASNRTFGNPGPPGPIFRAPSSAIPAPLPPHC